MRKLVSIVLCVILTVATVCPQIFAAQALSDAPAVLISGYASSRLFTDYGEKNQSVVWPFAVISALKQTLSDLPNFTASLFKMVGGDFETMGATIANGGEIILENMLCNPDGSSKELLETYPNDPVLSNYEYLLNNTDGKDIHEKELAQALADEIGARNVFIFHYDYRLGGYDISAQLNTYIKDVLEYTGARKVNLFGLSYGGFIVGVYLSLYGTNAEVHNAVMSVPALGGTSFTRRFFEGNTDIPLRMLLSFAETAIGGESNLAPLFENTDMTNINSLASSFLTEIINLPLYWGSMWDLMTPEDYNELKEEWLDSEANAEIIRKADIIHNDVMQSYKENFEACRQCGTNISILCSYGASTAFGGDVLGDVLLDSTGVSGAKCAKLGERFSDGYSAVGGSCSVPGHNHVSPSLEIDASCGYLPENTWFINGQYHGLYAFDSVSFSLVKKLMRAQDEITVHDLEEYPQFLDSDNAYLGVSARFDSSTPGYLDSGDEKLIVTNISEKTPIILTDIVCNGIELDFIMPDDRTLSPGESVEVDFNAALPEADRRYFSITVDYLKPAVGLSANSRTVDFSLMNAA